MFRNLKNKNVLMILLLLLIIASVLSYNMIQTTVEGFTSEDLVNYFEFVSTNGSFKFYKLKEAGISTEELATIRSDYNDARIVANVANPPTFPSQQALDSRQYYADLAANEVTASNIALEDAESALDAIEDVDAATTATEAVSAATDAVSAATEADSKAKAELAETEEEWALWDAADIIIGISNEDFTKVYDLEGNHLSTFSLTISGEIIIKDGKLAEEVAGIIAADAARDGTGMTTEQILAFAEAMKDGDTDIVLPERDTTYSTSSMKDVVLDYLLGNSGASFQDSGYHAPHYNSFESAMSTPSNPIVNPVNSMNPLDYSQSLFGPNVTPTMMQNMCKNSNTNNFSDFKNGNDSEAEDGDEDEYGDGSEANNGSTNGSGANNGSNNGYEANNGSEATNGSELQQPQTYSTSNMDSNTCQNCNGQQNSNNTCSSCENKNSILNGGGYSPHLPRPVLTNFSNFGN